jgi:hypothetical protein
LRAMRLREAREALIAGRLHHSKKETNG